MKFPTLITEGYLTLMKAEARLCTTTNGRVTLWMGNRTVAYDPEPKKWSVRYFKRVKEKDLKEAKKKTSGRVANKRPTANFDTIDNLRRKGRC